MVDNTKEQNESMARKADKISSPEIKRRTILRGVGAATGSALVGATFSDGVAASCHKDFECEEGEVYLKFEFNEDECEFELVESPSGFDEEDFTFQSAGNKEGEKCEPIFVEWQSFEYEVVRLLAKAGPECQGDEDFEDGVDAPFEYEVNQENPGGNQAAISNVQLCLRERDDDPELGEYQVDLIHGDPIFEFSAGETYFEQKRLLQALDSCGNYSRTFNNQDNDCFEGMDEEDAIVQDITDEGDGTATAKLDPGSCDGEDFALVSYTTEKCDFDGGEDQILKDSDLTGSEDDGVYTYEVELPEVEED